MEIFYILMVHIQDIENRAPFDDVSLKI